MRVAAAAACLVAALAVLVAGSASADTFSTRPSDAERALAARIVPTLVDGDIVVGERTWLDTQALRIPASRERWGLMRTDPPELALAEGQEALVIVWMIPMEPDGRVRTFTCASCVAVGVVAAVRGPELEPIAVAEDPIVAGGFEDVRPSHPVVLQGETHHAVIRRYRRKGNQSERIALYARKGERLHERGRFVTLSTNEGACGRIAQVAERRRPIGKRSRCESIWRFEAKVERTRRGLLLRETLQTAEAKRYRPKSSERKRTLRLGKRGIVASRKSLARGLPEW